MKRWIVELTLDGSVRPVAVTANSREAAKDAAASKHPDATRIYGAYAAGEWRRIVSEVGK